MTVWLDPLRHVLDQDDEPVRFFFRDDDVGWADDRLRVLLGRFAAFGLPVDLAVIPTALRPELTLELLQVLADSAGRVAVHQHGYSHDNHEPGGRKCEFGPSRAPEQQRGDIAQGRRLLADALGPLAVPIFTPPWNRCTSVTARCAAELGFRVLSRDAGATPLDAAGLVELPVCIDWFAHRKGVRLGPADRGRRLAVAAAEGTPVGVMLHHAVTDDEEMREISDLLELLSSSPAAMPAPMLALAGVPARAGEPSGH